MHKGRLGLAKVHGSNRPRWGAVVAEVDVLTPEVLQQLVVRPAVVGLGHAGAAGVAAVALLPGEQGGGAHGHGGGAHGEGQACHWGWKVSLSTVRAANWRRV